MSLTFEEVVNGIGLLGLMVFGGYVIASLIWAMTEE